MNFQKFMTWPPMRYGSKFYQRIRSYLAMSHLITQYRLKYWNAYR